MPLDVTPLPGQLIITDREFQQFRTLVRQHAGIALGDTKRQLVCSRLGRRLRHYGYTTFSQYYRHLMEDDPDGQELVRMINAITTNKTEFFREAHHFAFLRSVVLPGLAEANRGLQQEVVERQRAERLQAALFHIAQLATADIDESEFYVLDGADPLLPDPRSAWQPNGVHAPSRTVDTGAFAWSDHAWGGPRDGAGVLGGVVYELHVGTFTPEGTFDAAARHLDHLVRLGVDVVEVMPVAAFPSGHGWGYDGVGLYAVQDSYGGPEAFARFIDAELARWGEAVRRSGARLD